jgi:prefoldin subunit 5
MVSETTTRSRTYLTKRMNILEQENEELRNSLEKLSDWMEENCPKVREIIAKNEESR